ncbi:MAG: hypothetical protein GX561_09515 [Lentisphaerae bacterium]|nr:hypothetical protein [Lentisphaerota bacterium]
MISSGDKVYFTFESIARELKLVSGGEKEILRELLELFVLPKYRRIGAGRRI